MQRRYAVLLRSMYSWSIPRLTLVPGSLSTILLERLMKCLAKYACQTGLLVQRAQATLGLLELESALEIATPRIHPVRI